MHVANLELEIITTARALLMEASRQFSAFTDAINKAVAALGAGRRQETLQLIAYAEDRLGDAKLLVDEVNDWALDDPTGIVAAQGEVVIGALAVADADFQRAVALFKAQ